MSSELIAQARVFHDRFGAGIVEVLRDGLVRIAFGDGVTREIVVTYPGLRVTSDPETQPARSTPQRAEVVPSGATELAAARTPDRAIEGLARLRVLVAWAGELADHPWWSTQFHSSTARSWMNRIFPRTNFQARVAATTIAAAKIHDRSIGGAARYHLFRLPVETERRVADAIAHLGDEAALQEPTRENVVATMTKIAASAPASEARGPVRVGNVGDVQDGRSVLKVAGLYLAALQSGATVFPYFSDEG